MDRTTEHGKSPRLSVVLPFYNEEPNVRPVMDELFDVLDRLRKERSLTYEIICVDDGSTDKTLDRLLAYVARRPEVQVIHFGINYGQTAAISAGFHHARGDYVVTMDGDGQNDPNDIPALIDHLEAQRLDVVSGWRRDRKDPWLTRRFPSMMANRLISWITGVHLRDYGCTLKVYRKTILDDLHLYGEMHRFIPALTRWLGARVGEIPVNHRARRYGSSKYGLSRIVRVLLDLLVVKFLMHYSTRPIQFFGKVGVGIGFLGVVALVFVVIFKITGRLTMNRNPLLYVGLTLEMIACQIILMGLLGEMLARIYHETQAKPIYRVKRIYTHDTKTSDPGVRVVAVDS